MATKGIVVKFDARKGFGFIRFPEGGDDAFVHISDVAGRSTLFPGQRVTFDLAETPKGPAARNVQPGGRPASPTAIFLIVGWFWCWRNQPPWIPEVLRFLFPRP